jgi:tetratricopeptide (TPR) repeat protein
MVGGIAEAHGDLETALSHYEESLTIARALAAELGTPDSRRDVSLSLNMVGDIAKAHGDLETALSHYEESLAIRRALAAELGTPDSRRDVSVSLDMVGDIAKEHGDLETALSHYEESLAIARALAAELGTPESRRDVSLGLDRVGDIAKEHGDLETALAHYEESLAIRRALHRASPLPQTQSDLVYSLRRAAEAVSALGRYPGALAYYQELVEIRRAALREADADTGECKSELAWALGMLVLAFEALGQIEEALPHDLERLTLVRDLQSSPAAPNEQERLLLALLSVSQSQIALEDRAAARPLIAEATHVAELLEGAFDDPQVDNEEERLDTTTLEGCGDAWAMASDDAREWGDRVLAIAAGAKQLHLRQRAFELAPSESTQNELVWAAGTLASDLLAERRAAEAESTLMEVEAHAPALESSEDFGYVDTAAAHWEHKATCAEALGRADEARAHATRAKQLRERIAALEGDEG